MTTPFSDRQGQKNFVSSDVKNNAMRHIDFTPFRRIHFSGILLVFDTFFYDKKYPIGARICKYFCILRIRRAVPQSLAVKVQKCRDL